MGAAAEGQYVFMPSFNPVSVCFCISHVQRLMARLDRRLVVWTVAPGGEDVASSQGKADLLQNVCRVVSES